MFLRPVQESEFEDEYKGFVPSEGEVRYITNKNRECGYYLQGIDQCRQRIAKNNGKEQSENHSLGFLPCKRVVDAHYRCMTNDKFGSSIENVPEIASVSAARFFDCTFTQLLPMQSCRSQFDQVVREVFRSSPGSLN